MKNYLYIFFTFLYLIFGMVNNSDAADAITKTDIEGGAIAVAMCAIINAMTGVIGKSIATIGLIALAIGLFMGKLSWGLALATGFGIAMIFGAGSIIGWLTQTDNTASESQC